MKVAAAQYATKGSLSDTLNLLEEIVQEASGHCVELLLFPEAFLGGYPRTCSFGAVVGSRTDQGRDQYYTYWKQCVDLGDSCPDGTGIYKPGSGDGTRERLEQLSKNYAIFLVVGLVEKVGGSLYCACVFVDPEKGIVGKRRKVMPTGTERVCWGVGSPKTLKAVEATLWSQKVTMGAAICWENYMPLLRTSLYAQGVQIYLAPTADARDTWISTMKHIAIEGRCFVITCNQHVTSNQLPKYTEGYISDNTLSKSIVTVSSGGSAIIDPMGNVLQGPMMNKDGLLIYDIGNVEEQVIQGKFDMDVGFGGHYGRGDAFKLSVEGLDLLH